MPLRQLLDCKLHRRQGLRPRPRTSRSAWARSASTTVNAGWLIFGDGFNQGALRTVDQAGLRHRASACC
ncbi:MAG: hypothetical protein MZW92_21095 [Comamonadaceae bacterium]|nr:hypothetical protein [Comamonadaceae bacterium]